MYDSRFVFRAPIEIDCNIITDIYKNEVPADIMPVYRYDISRSPYLVSIADKYSWLSTTLDFFITVAGGFIPIHFDSDGSDAFRACNLNLPIQNTSDSITSWHEMPETTEWIYPWIDTTSMPFQGGASIFPKSASIKDIAPITLFSFVCNEPVIFNAKLPHSVKNKGFNRRVIASWHTKFKNYDEAKTFFAIN